MSTSRIHPLLAGLVLSLLVACGAIDTAQRSEPETPPTLREQVEKLLARAEAAESPKRETFQLRAAALLLEDGRRDTATRLLSGIEPGKMSGDNLARYSALRAELELLRGDPAAALTLLQDPALLEAEGSLSLERQIALSELRATVFALLGRHLASARERVFIHPLLRTETQRTLNRKAIWRSLMYLDRGTLEQRSALAGSQDMAGWLELALVARDSRDGLDGQVRRLDQWLARHRSHPAAAALPGDVELLRELAQSRPRQVALLLPVSGRLEAFGQAIRDGFLAAWYSARSGGGEVPEVRIYDTGTAEPFMAVYQRAVREGAELVIGPLAKENVSALAVEALLPVPTLALNRLDSGLLPPLQLYQFGLSPEDEASQLAAVARLRQHSRALVLAPEGEWGERVSGAFIDSWRENGGQISAIGHYADRDSFAPVIESALNIDRSNARARRIMDLLGRNVEFTPRRRQDVQMIFMLARPEQARSLKPLLNYLYAGDLPVYSISNLYPGIAQPDRDRDLDGVIFTDMPWVLQQREPLGPLIAEALPDSRAWARMHALGIDAWRLHARLRLLDEIPNTRVYGETGTLNLNRQREVEREVLVAQFRNGRAEQIPMPVSGLSQERLINDREPGVNEAERDLNKEQRVIKEDEREDRQPIPGGWP